jgi:8-oxo-dGTP diphosphatase
MKKTGFGNGRYNGFGGKKKDEETIPQAAVRELKEECGILAEEQHIYKVGELDFQFPKKPEWNQVMHVYFVKQWTGEPKETEEMRPEWFAHEDVPYDKMWEADAHWLSFVLAGHYVKGSYVYSEEQKLLEKDLQCSPLDE